MILSNQWSVRKENPLDLDVGDSKSSSSIGWKEWHYISFSMELSHFFGSVVNNVYTITKLADFQFSESP